MYRYERKFATDKIDDILSVDRYLLDNPILQLHRPYKSRIINNIYFDDFSDSSLYDNIDGSSKKMKIRLRWYNDNVESSRLEMKGRLGNYGTKKVWELYLPKMDFTKIKMKLKNYDDFLKEMKNARLNSEDDFSGILNNVRPVSFNSYQRHYLVDFSQKLRVTIDQDLMFYNWRSGFFEFGHSRPGLRVYEFKYSVLDEISDKRFDRFIRDFPVRTSKFSKFAYSSYSEELTL